MSDLTDRIKAYLDAFHNDMGTRKYGVLNVLEEILKQQVELAEELDRLVSDAKDRTR
jgi:hypothetical protein